MRFTKFEIVNFKGINKVVLDLDKVPHLNIYTLVGLNESGKTTILEAINYFQNSSGNENQLIPKSKRANFNESIEIVAYLLPDDSDNKAIREFAKLRGYSLQDLGEFKVTKKYLYSKTTFTQKTSLWNVDIQGTYKGSKAKSPKRYSSSDTIWQDVTAFIETTLIPKIVYYPNFLFDFPKAIYLESFEGEGSEQPFYRRVLQDVLDSLGHDLKIKDHLADRKRSATPNDIENIEKVLSDMGGKMTQVVFDAWSRISGIPSKNISVTLGNDVKIDSQQRHYIEIKIKDGTDSYFIGERSLGFRWFFAFLLFTQFRKSRVGAQGKLLFLLDEPASNLHQTGQKELLGSLEQLTDGSVVMYSTHSHHLIDPKWLAGAFIVINKGLKPEHKALEDDFNATKTNIGVERYYGFVAHYPKEEAHFKPILDVLDYQPGKLEAIPDLIIPEGKFDFYTLSYFQDVVLGNKTKLNIYPGAGADSHDPIISQYLGWGRKFVCLFDADGGGTRAKKRYLKDFGTLLEDRLYTLEDIDVAYKGYTTEDLIPEAERIAFTKTVFPTQVVYEKSNFNRALQEKYIKGETWAFSSQTKKTLKKVLDFLGTRMAVVSE